MDVAFITRLTMSMCRRCMRKRSITLAIRTLVRNKPDCFLDNWRSGTRDRNVEVELSDWHVKRRLMEPGGRRTREVKFMLFSSASCTRAFGDSWVGLIVLVAVAARGSSISAHAELERADPAPDALLSAPPQQLEFWFTERIAGEPTLPSITRTRPIRRRDLSDWGRG